MTYRREIQWQVGYDHRNDPKERKYGCHGMNIRFLLHMPTATMQFLLYTGWLPSWQELQENPTADLHPIPADLGYHADSPQYEDHASGTCDCRPSGKCFYDGSSLAANAAFKVLVSQGEEALWKHMEDMAAQWIKAAPNAEVQAD